jgi:hypothetical protein
VEVIRTLLHTLEGTKKKKKKKKREEKGALVRDTLHCGGERQENITPVWKVPRQCPLVLLVWVMCTIIFFLEGQSAMSRRVTSRRTEYKT